MKAKVTYRHNIMAVHSIDTFMGIRGGTHQDMRDVYFVRGIGEPEDFSDLIKNIDQKMCREMQSGHLKYIRLCSLPKLAMANDITFYTGVYDRWKQGGKIVLKKIMLTAELEEVLGAAYQMIQQKYQETKQSVSESMIKNFATKILYWLDETMGEVLYDWNERECMKVIATNVVKDQEYLFYYFLTLLGCDVLLIENKMDADVQDSLKRLSAEIKLGGFGKTEPEMYIPCSLVNAGGRASEENAQTSPSRDSMPAKGTQTSQSRDSMPAKRTQTSPSRDSMPAKGTQTSQSRDSMPTKETQTSQGTDSMPVKRIQTSPGRDSMPAKGTQVSQSMEGTATETMQTNPNYRKPVKVILPERTDRRHHTAPAGKASDIRKPEQGGKTSDIRKPEPGGRTSDIRKPEQGGKTSDIRKPEPGGRTSDIKKPEQGGKTPNVRKPEQTEKTFEELALLASSIVMIAIHDEKGEVIGTGSGIMIGRDGFILTNNHVASGGRFYSVRIEDEEEIYTTDEVIKYNSVTDLAVIRIRRQLDPLPIYRGNKKLVRGQKVVAIGSPLGLFNSVSDGIISGFRRIDDVDMIQFTAPISHGSSGGAVLNMQGEVIGISTAGIDSGQNINLAVGYENILMFAGGFMK